MTEESRTSVPVGAAERITSIDMLRGVAVLGILVINIYAFSMPYVATPDPTAMGGTEWYNLGTWFVTHILFEQKFITIFSILYGAGLVMMMTRAEARSATYAGNWFRRNVWLLVIGLAHGYLLWYGDILGHYALMGMLIFPLRHRSPRSLITIACVMVVIGAILVSAVGSSMATLKTMGPELVARQEAGETLTADEQALLARWEVNAPFVKTREQLIAEDVAAYRDGSYLDTIEHRSSYIYLSYAGTMLTYTIWRVASMMLIGMALMKLNVLTGAREPTVYRRMMLFGYGAGLPVVVLGAWLLASNQWDLLYMIRIGGIPNYAGSVAVAIGHIGLVMTIIQSGVLSSLMSRFAAVGRMAFTNYLMHSFILTTVFYGYGLGMYGQIPRLWQMGFVAAVIGFQLWFSTYWLGRFRYGPAEWVWRSLSYWRLQPMRRDPAS